MTEVQPRALVVDDSVVVRRVLVLTLLQMHAFRSARIDEASDGAIALRCMAENHYDLVLSDVKMPSVDGLEFVRGVRGELGDDRTPIFLISTLGSEDDVRLGMEAGATAYILKPLSPPVIKNAIEDSLREGGIRIPGQAT